jgi:hypothetical protein
MTSMNKLTRDVEPIAHSSPTAEVVFLHLAQRERSRPEPTDLRRLANRLRANGEKVDINDLRLTFKKLQDVKVGRFISPGKFHWDQDLKLVGKAAVLGAGQKGDQTVVTSGSDKTVDQPVRTIIMFPLASGIFKLELDGALTQEVADEVCVALKRAVK